MVTISGLLKIKGATVWSISPSTTTIDALKVLKEKDIGALLVLENGKIVGIISERDFVRRIAKSGDCIIEAPVSDYMTTNVFSISPEKTILDCMHFMTEKHIRHLPVVENEILLGMISIGDVVKSVIDNQETTIKQMEDYIEGRGYGT